MTRVSARLLLVAAALLTTACASDGPLAPGGAQTARVVLTTGGTTTLASLGDSIALTSGVLDRAGRPVDGASLRWSVSDTSVLQQDGAGVFRAVGNGRATIVAALDPGETGVRPAGYWAGPIADSIVVEVRQLPARLALLPVDTAFAALGAQRQLRVRVTDARGNPMEDAPPPLTWASTDSSVVAVDGTGLARSLGEGTARITVRGETFSGEAIFTVDPRRPHTSCMVFTQRRETQRSCVTLQLVMHAKETER